MPARDRGLLSRWPGAFCCILGNCYFIFQETSNKSTYISKYTIMIMPALLRYSDRGSTLSLIVGLRASVLPGIPTAKRWLPERPELIASPVVADWQCTRN